MSSLEVRLLPDLCSDVEAARKWEALVASNPASGIMQSLQWAEVKRRQGLNSFHRANVMVRQYWLHLKVQYCRGTMMLLPERLWG
jgi:hypothetical protein